MKMISIKLQKNSLCYFETIQGAAGFLVPNDDYLIKLKKMKK
jgi:4-aminobutyrate aminotransferase-like enzyme